MLASPTRLIRTYKKALHNALSKQVEQDLSRLCKFFANLHAPYHSVFLAGNGGSASLATHMAVDLYKQGGLKGKIIPLTDLAVMTAIGNDIGYDHVFAHPLASMAYKGDILIVISASGNSPNILAALQAAKEKSMQTIGFLGFNGGKAKDLCDFSICIDSTEYGVCEDCHVICMHMIVEYIKTLNGKTSAFSS